MVFLEQQEIVILTGRKMKSLQRVQLQKMGIPYFLNANGHPVVVRSVVDPTGNELKRPYQPDWIPKPLRK